MGLHVCVEYNTFLSHACSCVTSATVKTQHLDPSVSRLLQATASSHLPTLAFDKHESILHHHNFVISELLCKWNYIVCNLWKLAF